MTHSATADASEQIPFDVGTLDVWLRDNVEGYNGPLRVERFPGGNSNPTFRLETPTRSYVMRRKPSGPLVPGAHAVEREFRAISALQGSRVPVPRAYALCEDTDIAGTVFFVMEMVEGRIFWDAPMPEAPLEQRAACFDSMNATLAALHSIDPASVGLSGFGKAAGYLQRHIARWSRQYQEDEIAGRIEKMDRLIEWLPANIPAGEDVAIVHGDLRCNNLIFDSKEPQVAAVIDWELSTIGNPLVDFGYTLMMYHMPPEVKGGGLKGLDLPSLNIPDEKAFVDAYCARTGRDGIPNLEFYVAYNLFRFAAINHGIKGRYLRGNAANAAAARIVSELDLFVDLAWEAAVRLGAR